MTDQQKPEKMVAALAAGFQFPDAFGLYHYRCKRGHIHLIWNSRDGCVPFGAVCPTEGCRAEMFHEWWNRDQFDPFYEPRTFHHFWRDRTEHEAREMAEARVAAWWDHPEFPMSRTYESRTEAIEHQVQALQEDSCSRCHLAQATPAEIERLGDAATERSKDPELVARLKDLGYTGQPIRHAWAKGDSPREREENVARNRTALADPESLESRALEEAVRDLSDATRERNEALLEGRRELRILLPTGTDAGRVRLQTHPEVGQRLDLEVVWQGERILEWMLHHPKQRRGQTNPLGDLRMQTTPADPDAWPITEH